MSDNRIDVHAHYLGGAVKRLFESGFTLTGGYRIATTWSTEQAIAFMDRHGIATQVLSMPWSFDDAALGGAGSAARFCREVNTECAEIIREHPRRFGAFAAVPAGGRDQALAEIEYALDELKLDGIVLSSNACGDYLGGSFMQTVLSEAERRGVPLFIHPVDCPHIEDLGFGRPSSIIEYPFDTTRSIVDAIYRGRFREHPGLALIAAHCGGALPMLGWRIAEHTKMGRGPSDADIDPDHVRQVLRNIYYDIALAGNSTALLPTLEVTDTDHILFGSDWPAAPEPTIASNITHYTSFPALGTDDFAKIDRGNAVKLFPRLS